MIIYIIHAKPYENPLLTKLEIFNELSILMVSYHLFIFTNYVPNERIQYYGGWSCLLITLINIFTNIGIMMRISIREIRFKWLKFKQKISRWWKIKKNPNEKYKEDFD